MKQEGIHFKDTLHLRLEFKKIPRIHCLWEFTSLDRLDLNNNLIERIEGLDRLLNLTWLNLSYNRLEKIEGLESLRKLEVLNLSNNRISVLENMDTLEKLTIFCIENNLIGRLDNVLYLRKFKHLFNLNLCGNPASKEDDYKLFIAAYFPTLTFLDFRLLELQTKNDASVKYQNALEKMKLEELQQEQAQNAEQKSNKDDLEGFLKGNTFTQCRDLEDTYCAEVKRVAVATLENVAKGDVEEDMQDDVKALFTERDAVMDALETAHESHLLRINDQETQLLTRVSAWKVAVIERIQGKELEGNRTRISDFHRYTDLLKEQLEELQ
ncbi:dynein regulatory complex subunit 3 [Tautogolabrus adspersus]